MMNTFLWREAGPGEAVSTAFRSDWRSAVSLASSRICSSWNDRSFGVFWNGWYTPVRLSTFPAYLIRVMTCVGSPVVEAVGC